MQTLTEKLPSLFGAKAPLSFSARARHRAGASRHVLEPDPGSSVLGPAAQTLATN